MLILRELLFKPNTTFTQLNIKGLSSDHFSYHINTLIEDNYVKKNEGQYTLTPRGKEFANQMDTDNAQMEKQPKIAVMVVPVKKGKGEKQILVQERTKEPYFGYQGFVTGKIRFGEKVIEAARRELKEETGLDCDNFHLKTLVHDHVVLEESGELVGAKMFFIITAVNPTGEILDTPNGKNYWVTEEEFKNLKKKYYNEDNMYKYSQKRDDMEFIEGVYIVDEF
jgi:ADP-ribose pyrophosphatase YjhB (NUDIX family)